MSVAEKLEAKLKKAFSPTYLNVKDESHLHAGHAGAPEGGESHFRVTLVSQVFEGKNRVARHRAVNQALAEELSGPVHALAINAATPGEWDKIAN